MTIDYLKSAVAPPTQKEPLSATQVQNNAGGFVFQVKDWTRLERFLILGSEGGTYYVSEKKLTKGHAAVVERLLKEDEDGVRLVGVITEISNSGRAPKNDPAILALAMAAKLGKDRTRKAAFAALPKVCRTGTHLYHFVEFANSLGGWGRGLKRAVGDWFNKKPAEKAAFQMAKYQARDGWSAKDLLRLSHPTPASADHRSIYMWATQGYDTVLTDKDAAKALPTLLHAHEEAKTAALPRLLKLITEHNLQRESIPTEMLKEPKVWEALLPKMGLTALIRNLGTMTKIGLLSPLSENAKFISGKVADAEELHRSRIHPMSVLMAHTTYGSGHGVRGNSTWIPNQHIVDALDAAFYSSFVNVVPTGKNTLLAIDISGSMESGEVAGMKGITPRIAAAAMALVTKNVEKNSHMVGFTAGAKGYGGKWGGASNGLTDIPITPKMRIEQVVETMRRLPMGGTDCALPFIWAKGQIQKGVRYESVSVFTDNETWAGTVHPKVALDDYRKASGVPTRSAVVAFTGSAFSIADPADVGMMDFVGFDSAAPAVIADFFRGVAAGSAEAEADEDTGEDAE